MFTGQKRSQLVIVIVVNHAFWGIISLRLTITITYNYKTTPSSPLILHLKTLPISIRLINKKNKHIGVSNGNGKNLGQPLMRATYHITAPTLTHDQDIHLINLQSFALYAKDGSKRSKYGWFVVSILSMNFFFILHNLSFANVPCVLLEFCFYSAVALNDYIAYRFW